MRMTKDAEYDYVEEDDLTEKDIDYIDYDFDCLALGEMATCGNADHIGDKAMRDVKYHL
jgi:hypothetical protein